MDLGDFHNCHKDKTKTNQLISLVSRSQTENFVPFAIHRILLSANLFFFLIFCAILRRLVMQTLFSNLSLTFYLIEFSLSICVAQLIDCKKNNDKINTLNCDLRCDRKLWGLARKRRRNIAWNVAATNKREVGSNLTISRDRKIATSVHSHSNLADLDAIARFFIVHVTHLKSSKTVQRRFDSWILTFEAPMPEWNLSTYKHSGKGVFSRGEWNYTVKKLMKNKTALCPKKRNDLWIWFRNKRKKSECMPSAW